MEEWIVLANSGRAVGIPGPEAEIKEVARVLCKMYGEGTFRALRKPSLKLVVNNGG